MSMYNLVQCSSNYSETTWSLRFYSKDEEKATDFKADITNDNNFKFFEYKANLLGNTGADEANRIPKNATTTMLLKYLNNFWT